MRFRTSVELAIGTLLSYGSSSDGAVEKVRRNYTITLGNTRDTLAKSLH